MTTRTRIARLVTGEKFNRALKAMSNYSTATTINFTNEPAEEKDLIKGLATLVSDDSGAKAYMYAVDDTTINISPVEEDINMYANSSCSGMFYHCNVKNINLYNFDTSNVSDMSWMFAESKLTILDLSNFNTSKVTDMQYMFYWCTSLTKLDVSSFDTSNVELFGGMFQNCSKLTKLDVSSFDTSNARNLGRMFDDCEALTSLDLSSFDTSNVSIMNGMFDGCQCLTTLNLSSFDTSKVTDMSDMFGDCEALTSLDLSNFDISNVKEIQRMFYNCKALTELSFDLSKLNINNIEDDDDEDKYVIHGMFLNTSLDGAIKLVELMVLQVPTAYQWEKGAHMMLEKKIKNLLKYAGQLKYIYNSVATLGEEEFKYKIGYEEWGGGYVYLNIGDLCNGGIHSSISGYRKAENRIIELINTKPTYQEFCLGFLKIMEDVNAYIRKCVWEMIDPPIY